MKKIIKTLSYILIVCFFSIALSGCGKKEATDPNANKIVVWSFEDEDSWQSIKDDFERKNKGYELVYQKQKLNSGYENKVFNSILSGSGPDVWAMPNDWVYRHKEKLYPLPKKSAEEIDIKNKYVPAISESVLINNQIYALSPYAEPLMVFYNSKMFSTALSEANGNIHDAEQRKRNNQLLQGVPKTWSDFTQAAKLLTKKEGSRIVQSGAALGSSNITNANDILYLLMLQNETDIVSLETQVATFNLPKTTSTGSSIIPGTKALEFYTSFANPSSSNYVWDDSLGSDIEAFGKQKVAMIFGYSSLQNTLLQKYPDLRYKKAFVPQLQSDATQITDYARFNAYGVSRFSKNPTVSWSLIYSLMNKNDSFNSANRYFTSEKYSSYDISIANRESSNPEKLSLATAKSLVKGRFPVQFDAYLKSAIAAVNSNIQKPQAALDLAADKITDLIREENW